MGNGYLRNISLLVVDDCSFSRRVSARILRCFGAGQIYEALDGEDAKQQVAQHKPDIVLVDWIMHPTDGIAFTKWVRNDRRSPDPFLPIIMMSSFSGPERVFEARDAGVNEYLVKPASPRQLMRRVQAVIEKPRRFVRVKGYFGPDRRRRDLPHEEEEDRRSGFP